jgi:hypothetical protein
VEHRKQLEEKVSKTRAEVSKCFEKSVAKKEKMIDKRMNELEAFQKERDHIKKLLKAPVLDHCPPLPKDISLLKAVRKELRLARERDGNLDNVRDTLLKQRLLVKYKKYLPPTLSELEDAQSPRGVTLGSSTEVSPIARELASPTDAATPPTPGAGGQLQLGAHSVDHEESHEDDQDGDVSPLPSPLSPEQQLEDDLRENQDNWRQHDDGGNYNDDGEDAMD